MNISAYGLSAGVLCVVLATAAGRAQTPPPKPAEVQAQTADTGVPRYRPPKMRRLGKRTRVESGAVRGARQEFVLRLLAPRDTGLTASARPVLFWYTSGRLTVPVEVTIEHIDGDNSVETFRKRLNPPFEAGVHMFDTSAHDVSIEPGFEYVWNVLALSGKSYSSSPYAEATIASSPLAPELRERIAAAGQARRVGLYAGAGYWYDALAALQRFGNQGGNKKIATRQLRALLEQEDLELGAGPPALPVQ